MLMMNILDNLMTMYTRIIIPKSYQNVKIEEKKVYLDVSSFQRVILNQYRKTPILVPRVGSFSNASSFEMDQCIEES